MKESSTKRTERPLMPATASSLGLGDLRLGSLQSRAAARSLLEAGESSEEEEEEGGILYRTMSILDERNPDTVCTCKRPKKGEVALCSCMMPDSFYDR